jgi:hypothetical protein
VPISGVQGRQPLTRFGARLVEGKLTPQFSPPSSLRVEKKLAHAVKYNLDDVSAKNMSESYAGCY